MQYDAYAAQGPRVSAASAAYRTQRGLYLLYLLLLWLPWPFQWTFKHLLFWWETIVSCCEDKLSQSCCFCLCLPILSTVLAPTLASALNAIASAEWRMSLQMQMKCLILDHIGNSSHFQFFTKKDAEAALRSIFHQFLSNRHSGP